MLKDPERSSMRAQTAELLARLASDPSNGIAGILDENAIAKHGGSLTSRFLGGHEIELRD